MPRTTLVHLKGLKGSCISGDISPAFLTHPALLCGLEGHPERKAKPSSVFTEPLSSKARPQCNGCEMCAELHLSRKHSLSTNLPGVVLSLGGETAGKKASSKLVDECSKNSCPVLQK